MKTPLYFVFAFLIISGLSACTTFNYYTAGLNKTNMSQYRSFAMMKPEGPGENKPASNTKVTADQKINDAAIASLKNKGLKLQNDNPDLLVVYIAKVGRGSKTVYYYPGWGYPYYGWGYPYRGWGWGYGYPYYGYGWGYPYYGWGGYAYAVDKEHYKEGTIIIDLIDARTHKVVWRGYGISDAHDNPQKNIEEMPEIVKGIIDQLQVAPPEKVAPASKAS